MSSGLIYNQLNSIIDQIKRENTEKDSLTIFKFISEHFDVFDENSICLTCYEYVDFCVRNGTQDVIRAAINLFNQLFKYIE